MKRLITILTVLIVVCVASVQYGEAQTEQVLQTIGNYTPDEANSLIRTVQLDNSLNEKDTIAESNTLQQTTLKNLLAGRVTAVVDGDTIKVDINNVITTIRLIGVDTPESVHPFKPVEPYAEVASTFLKNLLSGEIVYIEYDPLQGEKDRYGRSLAYIYRYPDGLFVNEEIVRQGYGRCYTKYPFKHVSLFQSFEDSAKKVPKGLWQVKDESADVTKPANDGMVNLSSMAVSPSPSDSNNITVYITKTGSKYHRINCFYLSKSCIPINLSDAIKRGYTPCSRCNPPTSSVSIPNNTSELSPSTYAQPSPVAENGSYYGEISTATGQPKTVYVHGYYRKNGTYVRGYYRSSPRR